MDEQQRSLQTLEDIKRIMDRSSRFISLSGLSGISAGVCALVGAWLAQGVISGKRNYGSVRPSEFPGGHAWMVYDKLFWIAGGTLIAAIISAFLFTWMKSKKEATPIWGRSAMRVLINLMIPLGAGGIFLIRLIHYGNVELVAPGCLIFYGLALINASKYTLDDVRYLGFLQIILGIINLWFVGYGLYFWAFGFGVLHIIYGAVMWWKYDGSKK